MYFSYPGSFELQIRNFPLKSGISEISNENITLLTASEENMNSQVSLRMVHW